MKLLIVRHGTAEESASGIDAERPLTHQGKKEIKEVAAGLKTLLDSIDVIGASPLVRARQTAEIIARKFGDPPIKTVYSLVPGSDLNELAAWIAEHDSKKVIALVGHEPLLGTLITWLMTATQASRVEMGKGTAALLEFDTQVRPGSARLHWLLTRRQLEALS